MSSQLHSPFTPREVARVLFRRLPRMAVFFCLAIGLTLLAIALYPRGYTSEAKLFIRVGRESVALDPTATTGQTIMLQKTQVDEVNSALQMLTSRDVLKEVVKQIGAGRILDDEPVAGIASGSNGATKTAWIDKLAELKQQAGD